MFVQFVVLFPSLVFTYTLLRILYNIFLHPLRSIPGPLSARSTLIAWQWVQYQGKTPLWHHELHKKYGPVVRYAPNEVSFINPQAWKEIYGYRATSFEKHEMFYGPDFFGHPPGLIRADNVSHARQRKLVSHAFSDKALREQETLFKGYVELLVRKLKEATAKNEGWKVDMMSWYNFTTFDIMADLTFGEPLHLLEESSYTPWVRALFDSSRIIVLSNLIRHWSILNSLMNSLIPRSLKRQQKLHMMHSIERVEKRLSRKTDRPDIWTYVTRYSESEENKEKGLSTTEMHSNAALFMFAGTETTATELSGMTYFLLKDPARMERLKKEVRDAFSTWDDITITKLSQLEYLNACIEEGLRVYPPVPIGLPRKVPKGGAKIDGHWVPGGTIVALPHYAAYHSTSNFKNPDIYIPERWLPEGQDEYGSDRKDALNPFSHGPRNCLGKNLAHHEMRLVLTSVLWNFDMELCEESDRWIDQDVYLLWKKGSLMVKLKSVRE